MKKHRFIALILVLMLVLGFMPVSVARADNNITSISVESVYATPGDTVSVNVYVKNNPGILGATLRFDVDEGLSIVDATNGEAFEALELTKPGTYASSCQFVWDCQELSAEDVKDGVILTLSIKADDSIEPIKDLGIKITYKNGDIFDTSMSIIKPELADGGVKVLSYYPGDVNGDKKVNTTDVVLIRRFIAGGYGVTINEAAADVNADGKYNAMDVVLIRRYIAGGYDVVLKPSTGICDHSMTAVAYKAPTCTEDGNIAYWHCTKCDKYFTDVEGIAETSYENTVIIAPGHTPVIDEAVEATYTNTGLTEGSHCSVCNKILKAQETIPMLQKDQYSVIYHLDNNDSYLKQITIDNPNPNYYSPEDGLVLSNLKVDGYEFIGWFDGQSESATMIKEIPKGSTGKKELYAHWNEIEYTIQFDPGSTALVDVPSKTYKVSQGTTLPNPSWFGYTFVGWTDANGQLIRSVKTGTTGNLTLYANWTSKRNQTIPVKSLGSPYIMEDEDNGTILFAYEIGRMENVPLYTIKDLGNQAGITITETITTSGSITQSSAETIAEAISEATTHSSSWSLSKEWNDTIINSESHESGSESGSSSSSTDSINIGGKANQNLGVGGASSYTTEEGISSKNTVGASVEAEMSASGFGVKAGVKSKVEATSEEGYNYKESGTDSQNWNSSRGYEASKDASHSSSYSSSFSSHISDRYDLSTSHSVGGGTIETNGLVSVKSKENEYSSALSYSKAQTETTTKQYTNANAPEGYYRIVCAGTVHVYAVVGYDIATRSYFVYTYNVIDDKTTDFIDYSKSTPNFDDYENGVLPFEVPFYVKEYVDGRVGATDGLILDVNSGKITGYTGTAENVVIPSYMSLENTDGTFEAIKIKGIESDAFSGNTSLVTVSLPDSVTEIPDNAFSGCTSLTDVACSGVVKIGRNAFKDCTQLKTFTVNPQVTSLGNNSFDGVDKVIVNAANASVAESAVYSGAKSIVINTGNMIDALTGRTLHVPSSTDYFEFNGSGKTYENVRLLSDAKETVINSATFGGTTAVLLKLSSSKVTLNRITVNATGFGLILTADSADVALYGNSTVNSEKGNAVLSKSVALSWVNSSVSGKLTNNGNMMVCGTVSGDKNLSFVNGKVVYINEDSFEQMMNDSVEWILASEAPADAIIIGEKWTYDYKTTIESDVNEVEGYTLYDTTWTWGPWGNWSSWSRTAATKSDSRDVETRIIPATTKTQWQYSRYYGVGSTGYYYCYPRATGVCQTYENTNWLDSPLPDEWDGEFTGYGRGYDVNGNYVTGRNGSRWDMWWYNPSTRTVEATSAYTEYRYRDRSLIYTYHLYKLDQMESNEEVIASDSISNVQKWVKCVAN
ncbi:MAG: leucine-rich repeat protein [Eubacterium sp.]|nr:leucine-rich repeat protein [Eubacterium sp.]